MLYEVARLFLYLAIGCFALVALWQWPQRNIILSSVMKTGSSSGLVSIRLVLIATIMVWTSFFILLYGFWRVDFTLASVAAHSHPLLSSPYRLAAAWGHHEGSLLLWSALLCALCAIIALRAQWLPTAVNRGAMALMSCVCAGFLLIIMITSDPFVRLWVLPLSGADLNPLLQDPALAAHPPILYMGYSILTMLAAYVLSHASLVGSDNALETPLGTTGVSRIASDKGFLQSLRLFAMAFLTAGLALGSWWAYRELGWGGYWFWDPVENMALIPWLITSAMVHFRFGETHKRTTTIAATVTTTTTTTATTNTANIALSDRRHTSLDTSDTVITSGHIVLSLVAMISTIMGTFMVRSGLLVSVHSFASDPSRGVAWLLLALSMVCVGAIVWYRYRHTISSRLDDNRPPPLVWWHRPGLITLALILWITSAATVALGVFYPVISQQFTQTPITVGEPFFVVSVMTLWFILLCILALTRIARMKGITAYTVMTLGVLCALVLFVFNSSPPANVAGWWVVALMGGVLVVGLLALSVAQWMRMRSLRFRRWGWSWFAHLGITLLCAGVWVSSLVTTETSLRMVEGESAVINQNLWLHRAITRLSPEMIALREVSVIPNDPTQKRNYQGLRAQIDLLSDGVVYKTLIPERRNYFVSQVSTYEAAISWGFLADQYVVLTDPDEQGRYLVRYRLQGGTTLLWIGSLFMVIALIGAGINALVPSFAIALPSRKTIAQKSPTMGA